MSKSHRNRTLGFAGNHRNGGSSRRNLYYFLDSMAVLDFISGLVLKNDVYSQGFQENADYYNNICWYHTCSKYLDPNYQFEHSRENKIGFYVGISSAVFNEVQRALIDNSAVFVRKFALKFHITRIFSGHVVIARDIEILRDRFVNYLTEHFKGSKNRLSVRTHIDVRNLVNNCVKKFEKRDKEGEVSTLVKSQLIEAASLIRGDNSDNATVVIYSTGDNYYFFKFCVESLNRKFRCFEKIQVKNYRELGHVREAVFFEMAKISDL